MESVSNQPETEPLNYVEPYWSSKPIYPYYIEVICDGLLLDTIQLNAKSFFILGRSPHCDIVLDSPSASRKHAIIQHKDTGAILLYDLGSTHGTFLNKKIIPAFRYIEIHVGDHIRLGLSSKTLVLGGPDELQPEDGGTKAESKIEISREELYKRRVDQIYRLHEERERNKIRYKHNEDGITWGIDPEFEGEVAEENLSEEEELPEDLNILLKSSTLTDKQKSLVEKCNDIARKIEKLEKDKGVAEKKSELGLDELTYKQQKALQAMSEKVDKLKKQLAETKNNLKASLGKGKKEKEEEVRVNWGKGESDSDDEFYDRTKVQKDTEVKENETVHETYESLKTKLELLLKERQTLTAKLMEKPSAKKEEDDDELDKFMASNEKVIHKNRQDKFKSRLIELSEEIDKCNNMLRYVTPTFATLQPSKPTVEEKKEEQKSEKKKKNTEMSLAETMQRLEELRQEREKKEQRRIENEIQYEQPQVIKEIPKPPEPTTEHKVEEELELSSNNYFSEIVRNRNKDNINLDNYGIFKERYAEYDKRKEELEKYKANAPKEKQYGLVYMFKEPERDNITFAGKRPMQSTGIVDPVSKKVRKVQGPAPKPVPRNVSELDIEKEEDVEDLTKFPSEDLETVKKPHQ